MKILIPHAGELELCTLILDLNGTLTIDGKLIKGVKERLNKIKQKGVRIILFSGDTRGSGASIAQRLGIDFIKTPTGKDKKRAAKKLNPRTCIAIGNGLIDLDLFKTVKLSIATLQNDGVHSKTLSSATIVVPSIIDGLDLVIKEDRLVATLRP